MNNNSNNRGNNNNNNNRRRGRGNNNRQQGGGGQQVNRVDSRARGNAPQMLEKYRKLAHDAHLNGDRVQAEYYLQFADHYFRVTADTRVRQEETRARRDERWQEGDAPREDSGDDSNDFSVESDFPSFDQPPSSFTRREREERPERSGRNERPERSDRQRSDNREERDGNRNDEDRDDRDGGGDDRSETTAVETGAESNDANPYEPPENPFVRPSRGTRGLRPRREDRGPRSEPADDAAPQGLDPTLLPPSIGVRDSGDSGDATNDEAADEKPRRRARRKPTGGDADEVIASVG